MKWVMSYTRFAVLMTIMSLLGGFFIGCQSSSKPLLGPLGLPVSREQLETRLQSVLSEALGSSDPILRCHALETLATRGGTMASRAINQGLAADIPAVRFAAAIAAGDIQDASAKPALNAMINDTNLSVRLAAGYALERMGDGRFVNWYDQVLMGEDVTLASQACMLIGKLGNTQLRKDSKKQLWQALRKHSQDAPVRLQAAEALARLGDQEILRKLLVFAGSGYADDRMIAISGLEALGGTQAEAMLTALADDPQLEVRLTAIRALGRNIGDKDFNLVTRSLRHIDEQGDKIATARVRGLAVLALGSFAQPKDGSLLYAAMADEYPTVRVAAAKATIEFLKKKSL